ncbi:MAG: DUF3800 domain-containing protein, partial [Clostridiales Family XIII bacterium]|nr:DUF3800 domain-containing protein [Clostridiales Family XIII bacterium]
MNGKSKKLVFVDDAGDPGFKLDRGSSNFFVIACVIFDKSIVAEEVSQIMKKHRLDARLSSANEYKFSKTKKSIIKDLLNKVKDCDFRIRAICVDKS